MSLRDLGWDASWSRLAEVSAAAGDPGRVARVDRGLCTVLTADGPVRAGLGGSLLAAVAREPTASPCTGDWCLVRTWPDGPVTVEAVLPRRTAMQRAEASGTSRDQVLAANADIAAVVVPLHPEPNLARVERLLTLAWGSGARPLVVLSKTDLVPDGDDVAEDVRAVASGVDVVVCSGVTGHGLARIRASIPPRGTLALVGTSGSGKSTLTNRLAGTDVMPTREIRADGKGRHTSVRRELVLLPGGGAVIDTPGLRGVGLRAAPDAATVAFPDVMALAAVCRFSDCHHLREPDCAVTAAVTTGALSMRRLESWHRLQGEAATRTDRADSRQRVERFVQRRAQRRFERRREGPPTGTAYERRW